MKPYLPLLLFITIISCQSKNEWRIPAHQSDKFTSFEMSYASGWGSRFSLLVDSNWIYLAPSPPHKGDLNIKYGLLPHSLIVSIKEVMNKLQNGTTIKSNKEECNDCPKIAVIVIVEKDTVKLFQTSDGISPIFRSLVTSLDDFIQNGDHKKFNDLGDLETYRKILPPPPPMIEPSR